MDDPFARLDAKLPITANRADELLLQMEALGMQHMTAGQQHEAALTVHARLQANGALVLDALLLGHLVIVGAEKPRDVRSGSSYEFGHVADSRR